MFDLFETKIPGCLELRSHIFRDSRGSFLKIFHKKIFSEQNLEINFDEEYYSKSFKNVIRGFHFQSPPDDHVKLIFCPQGEVFDVLLDLRYGSPTYGKFQSFNLSALNGNMLYVPKGVAHAFCTLSSEATMVYKVSSVHSPQSDAGIRWNSIGVEWPTDSPIISDRDLLLPLFTEFKSPFSYEQ